MSTPRSNRNCLNGEPLCKQPETKKSKNHSSSLEGIFTSSNGCLYSQTVFPKSQSFFPEKQNVRLFYDNTSLLSCGKVFRSHGKNSVELCYEQKERRIAIHGFRIAGS